MLRASLTRPMAKRGGEDSTAAPRRADQVALERAGLVHGFAEGANRAPAWNSAGFSVILLPMRTRRRDTAKLAMSDVGHVGFLGHSRISTDVRRTVSWGGP